MFDLVAPNGPLTQEPADVYHSRRGEFLTSHRLAEFRRCPRHFRNLELGIAVAEDSDAFAFGRAAHVLILEGREVFDQEFAIGGPINPKTQKPYGSTTKAFEEWAAQQGKPVLDDSKAAAIMQMADAVAAHPDARVLLDAGQPELVYRTTMLGHACQARFDWLCPEGLVDLKTCDDLDRFLGDFRRYGYAHQLAFYRSLLGHAFGAEPGVRVIAVEKRAPYRVGVFVVEADLLDHAARDNREAMYRLERCRISDQWTTGFERPRVIDLATFQGAA